MNNYGITTAEAIERLEKINKLLPPLGKAEIEAIKQNPSLNIFQKWRLIRFIKKGGKE